MGYQLVRDALAPELAQMLLPSERIALLTMCQHALDKPKPGLPSAVYTGGHAGIALALTGRSGPPDAAGKQAARRAISALIDAGFVKLAKESRWDRRAVYVIVLGGRYQPALPVDNDTEATLC